jgi:hypothetical protein
MPIEPRMSSASRQIPYSADVVRREVIRAGNTMSPVVRSLLCFKGPEDVSSQKPCFGWVWRYRRDVVLSRLMKPSKTPEIKEEESPGAGCHQRPGEAVRISTGRRRCTVRGNRSSFIRNRCSNTVIPTRDIGSSALWVWMDGEVPCHYSRRSK